MTLKTRHSLSIAALAVLAMSACGGIDSPLPWDKNRDGVIGACEGLGESFCSLYRGCHPQQLACLAVCLDDGRGGCLNACPEDSFECVPSLQIDPPLPRPLPRESIECETLNQSDCGADPRCEYVSAGICPAACIDDGHGGCLPCQAYGECHARTRCTGRSDATCEQDPNCSLQSVTACSNSAPGVAPTCDAIVQCVERPTFPPPAPCELLEVAACVTRVDCQLGDAVPVCTHDCEGSTDCCGPPVAHCITRPTNSCSGLSVAQCALRNDCDVQPSRDCDPLLGAPCTTECVPAKPFSCGDRSLDACTNDGQCELRDVETGCELACPAGKPCPSCARTTVCAPRGEDPTACEARSEATCANDPACELREGQSAGAPYVCVTRTTVDCASRDLAACEIGDGLCMVEPLVCTAECIDDGRGGCKPCDAYACVPVPLDGGSAP